MRSSAVIGLLAVGLVVGGCGRQNTCDQDADCPDNAMCDPELKGCVERTVCTPACAEGQECTNRACSARYSGITVLKPVNDGGMSSSGTFEARLEVINGKTRADPSELSYRVTRPDGAIENGKMPKTGEGLFAAPYSATVEGSYKLVVSYPAANLTSATVTFSLDKVAPTISLWSPFLAPSTVPPSRTSPTGTLRPRMRGAVTRR